MAARIPPRPAGHVHEVKRILADGPTPQERIVPKASAVAPITRRSNLGPAFGRCGRFTSQRLSLLAYERFGSDIVALECFVCSQGLRGFSGQGTAGLERKDL